jgi:signal transduction histidine kinase
MAISGAEETQQRAADLLELVTLVAREAPEEVLFATVAERAARRVGTEAGSVVRYLGDERAVVVGVWREDGLRGFPVNAELDFDARNSALGRARRTRKPARADTYEGLSGELPVLMRAVDIRASVAAPVTLGDDVWGAVVASTTRDGPLPAESENRLGDFTDLVELAVANTETRRRAAASRVRIVEAADAARRRLERDLHQGTQQHLLALTLKLRIAHGRAEPGSEIARLLEDALAEADVANTELRELARGLYPIVLTERGLTAALQALTARAGVRVQLLELPSRRFPRIVETTAYFVVADTLVGAHGIGGPDVSVMVGDRGDHVVVEIRAAHACEPLPGLADRVAAIGGRLHVDARPDGSVVRAEIPVER